MAGNTGNKGNADKSQGVVVAKPTAPQANPQAKVVTGTVGQQATVAEPKRPNDPPPNSQTDQTPAQEIPPKTTTPTTTTPLTTNPQVTGGTLGGARDLRSLPSGTFVDKTLNEAVRRVFRGNINERAPAAELFEKFNQIAPPTGVPGRTGPQSEFSAPSSSSVTSIGGHSVAQMSLFERAHAALADAERRLAALKPMQTPSDPENLEALRAITLVTYRRLVNEFGRSGGPRSERADKYFIVLNGMPALTDPLPTELGSKTLLGKIHDQFKLASGINTQEDSANVANFRIVKDNLFDVQRSWKAFATDRQEDPSEKAARFSRFLITIQDDVADVETAMDNINFDATDRDSTEITGAVSITVQGLLSWITEFAAEEGPEMVSEGGLLGIAATLPTLEAIHPLVGVLKGQVQGELVKASVETLESHLGDAKGVAVKIDEKVNPKQK